MTNNDTDTVLTFLRNATKPHTTQEIASSLGVDKSTVHKVMVKLRKDRLVQFLDKKFGWVLC